VTDGNDHWGDGNVEDAAALSGFLPTKLTIPVVPPGLVARERLFDALDAGTRGPLTLLAGPAGTGKTALVASWIDSGRSPGPVAWLSLDATDDSRPRFWRLMLAALAGVAGPESAAGRLLVTSEQTVDAVLPTLVGVLAELDQPIVIVLDDFDEITDPAIMADLELLLRTPPPALRLVATARRAPSLRLQRLRLAGTVVEIDPTELVFTRAESVLLLEGAGVTLTDPQAGRLWERTEGWAAGLRLTAMALRSKADPDAFVAQFAGDEAPVADYLFEEILSAQSPEIREFLLRTSITDTITGELADVLTGQTGGGATLAELHQDGIMATALDDHREWFRYHGLFRGLLRSVMRREEPQVVPELHRRAARWLADHTREVEAARHAVAAQDWELLADIVARHSFPLLVRGELGELAEVLRAVPPARMHANAGFPLVIAGGALESGDAAEAQTWIAMADANLDSVRATDSESFRIGRAIIGLYRSRLTGDVASALTDALPLMGGDRESTLDSFGPGSELRALALINLGALELWTGGMEAAARDLRTGTAIAADRNLEYLELYGRAHLAVHHLWMGEVAAADAEADRAIALAEQHGWRATSRASVALVVKGTVSLLRGDLDTADELIARGRRAIARSVERPLRANAAMNAARLLRVQGRPEDALRAIAEVRADVVDSPFWTPIRVSVMGQEALALHELGRSDEALAVIDDALAGAEGAAGVALIVRARILVALGRADEAIRDLDASQDVLAGPMLGIARSAGPVLRALAERQLGHEERSIAALDDALSLVEEDGVALFFMYSGDEVADLLVERLRSGGEHEDTIRLLLAHLESNGASANAPQAIVAELPAPPPRSEDLSERELAVLRFLPTMMSNREIADELFVSVNTVKTHLKQIYRKLDAHDRRDAVTRARRLGLLAPPPSGVR
jgi:LuxR family maltose regulon positive regulatory protein